MVSNESDQELAVEEEFLALAKATDKETPAKKDVRALRRFFDNHPELWHLAGDLAEQAMLKLIGEIKATAVLKESLKIGFNNMQVELGLATGSRLDQLLVQQVVLAWMRLAYVEYQYSAVTTSNATHKTLEYWEKRLNASQRRFLRASESLVRIRKLQLPAVQINMAQQQVNQVNN